MKLAVIDLGTNTCNLLIAEINFGKYSILNQSKQLVRLGDHKIKENEISTEAISRVHQAFAAHNKLIEKFGVEKVKVIATSAVRSAKNKTEFIRRVASKTGRDIEIISGEKEAELIFKGVLLAFGELEKPAVVLDIGGGSNEIIIGSGREIQWKESRQSGMSRVVKQFEITDPIQPEEIRILQDYFMNEHREAFTQCKKRGVKKLIGCSGSFDTVADMLDQVNPGEKQRTTQEITPAEFYKVHDVLIHSTRDERSRLKGMDMVRVDLIVPAVVLIELLVSKTDINQIVQTDFALREGILYEELAD